MSMSDASEKQKRPPCPYCGSTQISKNGSTHHKKQKFICKDCRRQFVENRQKKFISSSEKQLINKLLLERISLRGITRCLHISMSWLQGYVNSLLRSVPNKLRVSDSTDLDVEVECDELWSYVKSKENPVYIWLALARKSRQIIGFHLGDRTRKSAGDFWQSIPENYQSRGRFYTDLWESYVEVIPSGNHCPSDKKSGQTTRIERFNNTLRHRCSRLVRKNLAFSKNFFNHAGAILYFIRHYNESILTI